MALELVSGDRLLLFTDGLVETRAASLDAGCAQLASPSKTREHSARRAMQADMPRSLASRAQLRRALRAYPGETRGFTRLAEHWWPMVS